MRKTSVMTLICVIGIFLPALLSAQQAAGEADGYFTRAQAAYAGGSFNAAIDYLLKAEAAFKQSAPADGEKTAAIALWLGASYYQVKFWDESIRQFERALTFYRSSGDVEHQLAAINGIANTCLALKKLDMIIFYYTQAVALLDQTGNREYKAVYLAYIGGYYYQLKKYKEAIDFYSAAADVYASLKNAREVFNNLNNIGGVYFYSGEKEKALEYYTRAYDSLKDGLSPAEAVPILNNIASIAQDLKKYGQAAAYFQLLYPLVRDNGSPHDVYQVCRNAGIDSSLDGNKDVALRHYLLALSAGREYLDQEELADILSRIAETASDVNDFKTAVSSYQELAALSEKNKAWEDAARAYNNIGFEFLQKEDYSTAIGYLKKADALSGQIKDPELLSGILYNIGQTYYEMEDYAESLSSLKKYIQREGDSDDKAGLINAFLRAGSSCAHQSMFQDAQKYFSQAEKAAAAYGKKEFIWSVFQFYGDLYERMDEYPKALGYYQDALAICRELGFKDSSAIIMTDMGSIHTDMGEYDKALEYYYQALEMDKELGIPREIATVNGNIGHLYYETGDFDKALANMNLSLAYYESSTDYGNYASALNNIGDIYRLWANLEQALGYYNKALAVADEYNLADVQATVYNNLGMLYKAKEDFPKALELFNKALGINKKLSDKALVSVNLSNIGETYRQLLDYDKAADYFLQALAIDKEIGIRSRIAKRLNGVALLFSDNGDYATSNTYLLETLKYADASGKVDLATYYGNLGFNYCQLKQFDRAVEYLNKAVEMKEDLRKTAQGTIRMDYLASQIFTYQNLIFTYASAGKPEKALEAMELSRAKYLAERISNTGGLSAAYPGLAAVRKYLDDDTVVIGFSNVGRYFIPMRTVITTKKLEVKELNPEALRISAAAMDEIRAANMKTRGFNIAAGGAAEERKDAGVDTSGYFYDTLSNVVYNFRSLLQKPGMDFLGSSRANEMAKALYGFLLGDLGTLLAEKKKIIIIPDNVLGLLPFETLIDGDNRFVVETHDVEYEHSLTVMQLVHERRYDGARRQLIAFGGAVYDGQSAAAPQSPRPQADASVSETELEAAAAQAGRGNGAADMYSLLHNAVWQNLPGTLAEVTSIGKMFPSATVITGDKVSEENVKALSKRGELGRYKIIHFATHGLTVPDYPELSSLVLSYPGANKNGGDGYLQAPEIAGLSIKADFVNLSACETGLGKIYGGEGIVGLSQSFIIAGANGVSVSLWSVADEPTMEFMTDFYALIKDGNTNFAAGESAVKRTFIKTKNYRHPYYWAPFVYYGK